MPIRKLALIAALAVCHGVLTFWMSRVPYALRPLDYQPTAEEKMNRAVLSVLFFPVLYVAAPVVERIPRHPGYEFFYVSAYLGMFLINGLAWVFGFLALNRGLRDWNARRLGRA